nr:hypothetical protein GCM10025732_42580 [Glycomyces mayteni]
MKGVAQVVRTERALARTRSMGRAKSSGIRSMRPPVEREAQASSAALSAAASPVREPTASAGSPAVQSGSRVTRDPAQTARARRIESDERSASPRAAGTSAARSIVSPAAVRSSERVMPLAPVARTASSGHTPNPDMTGSGTRASSHDPVSRLTAATSSAASADWMVSLVPMVRSLTRVRPSRKAVAASPGRV